MVGEVFVFLRSLVFLWGLVGGLIVLGLDRVLWWALFSIGVVLGEGLIATAFGLLQPFGLRALRLSSIAGAIDQTL